MQTSDPVSKNDEEALLFLFCFFLQLDLPQRKNISLSVWCVWKIEKWVVCVSTDNDPD